MTVSVPAGIALAGALVHVPLPDLFAGFGTLAVLAGLSFLLRVPGDLDALEGVGA